MRLLQALLGNHLQGNAAILGRYSCIQLSNVSLSNYDFFKKI